MIEATGNVDDKAFPHYIADYDFFCRLRRPPAFGWAFTKRR